MAIPGTLPKWDDTEVNSVAPDTDHEDEGWLAPGGIPEKPPFETFNHWMNNVYKWVNYFTTEARRLWQNQKVTHNMTADSDYELTADQNSYGRIIITDTSVNLTTSRNIVVDVSERSFLFQNDTAEILTVKTSAGSGIAVSPSQKVVLLCDGTNVIDGNSEIAVGQTWQNVSGSRAVGVTYTNTSGKPIQVEISATSDTANDAVRLAVDGFNLSYYNQGNTSLRVNIQVLIPNGSTYILFAAVGTASLIHWNELRL